MLNHSNTALEGDFAYAPQRWNHPECKAERHECQGFAAELALIQGQIIFGIVLLIAAALVGPGGHSIFRRS